ncbi:MAG: hypothetical protein WAM91_06450 [Candidatus Acidiferrales bacterium]
MTKPSKPACERDGCPGVVPRTLTAKKLCVDHYLEDAMDLLEEAVTSIRDGNVVSPEALDKLRDRADFAVNYLAEQSEDDNLRQKEQVLHFLLGLANLHEYLSHNAPLVGRPR